MMSQNQRPSKVVKERIFQHINSEFNPKGSLVFSKAVIVHIFASLASMSICPQFGLRVYGEGGGLMNHFMHLGSTACLFLCGTFYVSFSALFIFLILGRFERRILIQNKWIFTTILTLGSFGLLSMFSREAFEFTAIAWIIGAVISSMAISLTYQYISHEI